MSQRRRTLLPFSLFLLAGLSATLQAQHPGNSNSYYQQLRSLLPGSDSHRRQQS